MDIKHIHCMLEDMAEYGKCMIEAGTENEKINICDASKIVDMVKDLAQAEYYARIVKEMRKVEEEGQAGKTAEALRDLDRVSKNRMYYTPMSGANTESKFDKAKRFYTETKELHNGDTPEDKRLTMQGVEKVLNVVFDEIDEMLEDASPELRNMVRTKGMSRFQKIQ